MDAQNPQNPSIDAPINDAQVVVLTENARTLDLDALLNKKILSISSSKGVLDETPVLENILMVDIGESFVGFGKIEHVQKFENLATSLKESSILVRKTFVEAFSNIEKNLRLDKSESIVEKSSTSPKKSEI